MAGRTGENEPEFRAAVTNKKAFFNYEIVEKVEGGLVLVGTEVKSLRAGQVDLEGSYALIRHNECWLVGCNIAQYPQASGANHQPIRDRKVLLHRRQIAKLSVRLQQRGFTMVPLRVYFNRRGLAKVELGLGRGKRQYDKRQLIQQRQMRKDIDRDMRPYKKGKRAL
jgi:SsrA-binding protein